MKTTNLTGFAIEKLIDNTLIKDSVLEKGSVYNNFSETVIEDLCYCDFYLKDDGVYFKRTTVIGQTTYHDQDCHKDITESETEEEEIKAFNLVELSKAMLEIYQEDKETATKEEHLQAQEAEMYLDSFNDKN